MSAGVNVRMVGFSRIDFDRREIRKALRIEGNLVRDVGRSLAGSASPAGPGQFPGRRTGVMQRAIASKTSRDGLAAIVQVRKTKRMGKDFYPAFQVYGVKKRKGKVLNPGLLPRADPVKAALERRRNGATEAIRSALLRGLVPRK